MNGNTHQSPDETIPQNDCPSIDSRLMAQELGVQHKNVVQTIKKYQSIIESQFGGIICEAVSSKMPNGAINPKPTLFYMLTEDIAKFLISKSRHGLDCSSIEKFKEMGFDFSLFPKGNSDQAKTKESKYSDDLAKKLNGRREIKTLAGTIDVLTSTEIIEVKKVNAWKSAIGQNIVYGHYYPSHKKRIHLYGETQESFLEMIKSHCSRLKITVTWEP